MPEAKSMTMNGQERRLSPADPTLKAVNKMAEVLDPYSRTDQLKILASVCCSLGMTSEARLFLNAMDLEKENA